MTEQMANTVPAASGGEPISGWLPWQAAAMLAWREILRFFRQGSRVVGAIVQPLIFWIFYIATIVANRVVDYTLPVLLK